MKLDNIIAKRLNKTIYRDGDNCIKMFDEGYSKAEVLNEALNQARVETTTLNIPKIKEVLIIDGKWAIVSEFIEGETLAEKMAKHPEKTAEYLELFVDLQIKMHAQKTEKLPRLKEKMHGKIDQAQIDDTTKYDLHTRIDGTPKHTKLCHGDFNPTNIIITNDGTTYIVDWAHATQGNASADVARTYLLFCLDGQVDKANAYLELFCAKSGVEKPYIQSWMPIVAASQSVKGNVKEREFLLSWVNVVDYE